MTATNRLRQTSAGAMPWAWLALACALGLMSSGVLRAQSLIVGTGTNAFQPYYPATTILTEENVTGNATEQSTAAFISAVGMEIINASPVTFEYGSFSGQSALAFRFTYQVDTNKGTPAGGFVVLFDTDRNGSFDSGVGFNIDYKNSVFNQSFGLTSTVSSSSLAPSSVSYSTGTAVSKYVESTALAGKTLTVSIAFLASDLVGAASWPTNVSVPTTAFTSASMTANTTYSGLASASGNTVSGGIYDWYGTSATSVAIGSTVIPETSTTASISVLAGLGAWVAWRRRPRKTKTG